MEEHAREKAEKKERTTSKPGSFTVTDESSGLALAAKIRGIPVRKR